VLEECVTEEQHFVVRFFGWEGAKELNAMVIHKETLSVYGGKCLSRKATTGSRNSLKDDRKSQMMPDQVALLRLRKKQLAAGGRVDSSSQEDNDRVCSN
jgi:hypothetical protein